MPGLRAALVTPLTGKLARFGRESATALTLLSRARRRVARTVDQRGPGNLGRNAGPGLRSGPTLTYSSGLTGAARLSPRLAPRPARTQPSPRRTIPGSAATVRLRGVCGSRTARRSPVVALRPRCQGGARAHA